MTDDIKAIRDALARIGEPFSWLHRAKSNTLHKPPPAGTPYVYGDTVTTLGNDDLDYDGPVIDFVTACHPERIARLLDALEQASARADDLAALVAERDKTIAKLKWKPTNLTQEYLKTRLVYNDQTGVFTWLSLHESRTKVGDVAGTLNNHGYITIKIAGKLYTAHRLAWLYVHGEHPVGMVDHIDGDKTNNRIANLRVVDNSGNMQNQVKARANSTHGYLGVTRKGRKYQAHIKVGILSKYLGVFGTPEEAHAAYVEAKRQLHPMGTL